MYYIAKRKGSEGEGEAGAITRMKGIKFEK